MNRRVLGIDAAAETDRITQWLRENMRGLHRSGAVLGISGGIDSSVCLALCIKAFGPERVVPLLLPEKDSDPLSEDLARMLAAHYGVAPILETITPALDGLACYERRDEAIARVFPEYDPKAGYKAKIVLPPDLLDKGTLNTYSLTIITPDSS
jgi:NAD+ synthase